MAGRGGTVELNLNPEELSDSSDDQSSPALSRVASKNREREEASYPFNEQDTQGRPFYENFDEDDVLRNSIVPAEALVMAINQEFKDRDENSELLVEKFDTALGLEVPSGSPVASSSSSPVIKQGSSKILTREEREAKLGEAREAAARRKAAQRGSGTQHTAAGTGDEAHEPEDVSTKPDTVKVPGSSNKDLDPAKREVLMEALVEVEEEIAKIRKRDQAERGSMLRALKKRYHPDSQRIMKWLYEAIFDHINKYTADIEQ